MQKIRAEIHLGNIRRNAEKFLSMTGKRLCAVVKANAYGHGAEEVTTALEPIADTFAVALIDEAIAIRGVVCGKEILVFTPPMDEIQAYTLAVNGFTASIPDLRTARLLSEVCRRYALPVRAHLKVNTGMNRYGMNVSMLGKVCKFLSADPFVRVTGLYSHLYTNEYSVALVQRARFVQAQAVCKRYYPDVISHLSATYGAMLGKEFAFDMTRIGIGLYGYEPSGTKTLGLEKGMTVYAPVVTDRKFSYGGAGYGKTFSNEEIEKIGRLAVCRYGYADGFLRRRDNGTTAWEKNANNLCMDVCIRKGGVKRRYLPVLTDADETAEQTGTISYEVLCAATRRAEFVYDDE